MPRLSDISPELLKAYQEEIGARGSNATTKRKVSSLKKFFSWAQDQGYISQNPLVQIQEVPAIAQVPSSHFLRWGILGVLVILTVLLGSKVKLPISFKIPRAQQELIVSHTFPSPSPFKTPETPSATSSGDVVTKTTPINPNDTGTAQLIFEGSDGNQLDIHSANLTSDSLIHGIVSNNATGYNLLELQSGYSPVTRFSVDSKGNTRTSGNLAVDQNINLYGNLNIGGVTRLNNLGRLASITGYYQDSGLFEIDQGAPDTAKIEKIGLTAMADSLTLTLDETGKTKSDYDTLVLSRKNANTEGYALYVKNGNVRFAENLAVAGDLTVNDAINSSLVATNALNIANSTAPSAGITNGIQLFAVDVSGSHELRVMDEAGNISTLSPHNFSLIPGGKSEEMAWSFYSENDGVAINADITKALRLLEKLTGEQLVYIKDLGTGVFQDFSHFIAKNIRAEFMQTKVLSPIPDSDLVINLANSPNTPNSGFGKLLIKGQNGADVISFDSEGNATFSGTVFTDKIASKTNPENLVTLEEINNVLREVENQGQLLSQLTTVDPTIQTQDLYVTNIASLNSLSVMDSISLIGGLIFQNNTINSLTNPLSIQSLALTPIELMAGKLKIDTSGNVTMAGSLTTEKLTTNQITIASSQNTTTKTTDGTVIETNATIGKSTVPKGSLEIIIKNPKVTDYTLVYVTPTSDTQNKVLYVKAKTLGEFKVGFSDPIDYDTEFNWWIIDTH